MFYVLWGCPKGNNKPEQVKGKFPTHKDAVQRRSELVAVGWSRLQICKRLEDGDKQRRLARPPKLRSRSKTRGR